jgi:ABC-type transporter Mla MlaB component
MIELSLRDGVLFLDGDLERGDAARLNTQLPALLLKSVALDCTDLDIVDGGALACLARLLKDAAHAKRFEIRGAPQLLAHTLYRVNALEHFDWLDVRFDEASTQ